MRHEPRWRRYFRFWRRDIAGDVEDELAFHFEQRVREYRDAGLSSDEATVRARQRFGEREQTRAQLVAIGERVGKRVDRAFLFDALWQDLAFAVRSLRRAPGVAVASIVTMALGVGANAAMFSLADRLFIRSPAGISQPSQMRRIYLRTTWTVGEVPEIASRFTYPAFTTLESGLAARVQLAGFSTPDTMPMQAAGVSATVHGSYVTDAYPSVLGVRPALGRFFAHDETIMGQPVFVAVISDGLWRRVFGADTAVLGRAVEINHQRVTIIGVAARGFTGTDLDATDVWMPLASFPAPADGMWYKSFRAGAMLRVIGRATPGTSDDWMSSVGTAVVRRTLMDGSESKLNVVRDTGAVVLAGPLLESLGPTMSPMPEVAISQRLMGVTLIVLVIACANVASLLLVRASARRREIAVRLALGISRRRLITLLLIESIVLSVLSGIAALLIAQWTGLVLRHLIMPAVYWESSVLDARVVVFTMLVACATGIAAGLIPAIQASRPDLTSALKSGARDGSSDAAGARLRASLLVAQVALSVVLLYGAGLFVRSLVRVRAVDLGYDGDRLVYGTAFMLNPDGNYLEWGSDPRLGPALKRAAAGLARAGDVENVSLSSSAPMVGYAMVGLFFKDGSRPPRLDNRDPAWSTVTDSYFATSGLKLVRGRFFIEADRDDGPVMVVNETAARMYWPHDDAIGQCIVFFSMKEPCTTVVGVVRDAHLEDIVEKPTVQLITRMTPLPDGRLPNAKYVVVRARRGRAAAVAALIRGELRRSLPQNAVTWVKSMDEKLEPQLRPWRVGTSIFTGFGVLALLVSVIGTYSVMAYSVSRRAHEMSVRMALGARATDLMRHVVGQGVRVTALGVAVGAGVSLMMSGVLRTLLYDTTPRDPLVVAVVAVLLVLSATLASALPARRAAAADPVGALRAE